MPKPNKELISVRIDPQLIKKVEKFAEKNLLNTSDVIRLALERMFDNKIKYEKKI